MQRFSSSSTRRLQRLRTADEAIAALRASALAEGVARLSGASFCPPILCRRSDPSELTERGMTAMALCRPALGTTGCTANGGDGRGTIACREGGDDCIVGGTDVDFCDR